jgi:hypothetical protein
MGLWRASLIASDTERRLAYGADRRHSLARVQRASDGWLLALCSADAGEESCLTAIRAEVIEFREWVAQASTALDLLAEPAKPSRKHAIQRMRKH